MNTNIPSLEIFNAWKNNTPLQYRNSLTAPVQYHSSRYETWHDDGLRMFAKCIANKNWEFLEFRIAKQ